jgi:K+/H+ antiporter YhaU regulatory subunit KhtT
MDITPLPNESLEKEDVLVIVGKNDQLTNLEQEYAEV